MNDRYALIFWDTCISPHKADFIMGVSKKYPLSRIILIAATDVPEERRRLGWNSPTPEGYEVLVGPDISTVMKRLKAVCQGGYSAVHIMSGIKGLACEDKVIPLIKARKEPVIILSEPRVFEGTIGLIRLVHSWVTERWYRKHASAVLAIGCNGPAWFKMAGYSEKKIFPFGYFVDRALPESKKGACGSQRDSNRKINVCFVGRVIESKGVYQLANAISLFDDRFEFHIVGDGLALPLIKHSLRGESSRVKFYGAIDYKEIPGFLEHMDVLVLPSLTKDDGWGVVVSEALFAGVAVVASRKVGAALVVDDYRGRAIDEVSPESIRLAVQSLLDSNSLDEIFRIRRYDWACKNLCGAAGAEYFGSILEHVFYDSRVTTWPSRDSVE